MRGCLQMNNGKFIMNQLEVCEMMSSRELMLKDIAQAIGQCDLWIMQKKGYAALDFIRKELEHIPADAGLTVECIMEKLGLKPFDEFEYNTLLELGKREAVIGRKNNIIERYRQTGRTTRMLVEALSEISFGKSVIIVAHNNAFARDLEGKFCTFARRCNIPIRNISFTTKDWLDNGRSFIADKIYFDHVVNGEQ